MVAFKPMRLGFAYIREFLWYSTFLYCKLFTMVKKDKILKFLTQYFFIEHTNPYIVLKPPTVFQFHL